ncbi:MAG: hypothetical protein FWE09_00045 [Treponema sp.]|nr:hypothetical protein [Treponema sp.]
MEESKPDSGAGAPGSERMALPLQTAMEIQDALRPLGFVIERFGEGGDVEAGCVVLCLRRSWPGLPFHDAIKAVV